LRTRDDLAGLIESLRKLRRSNAGRRQYQLRLQALLRQIIGGTNSAVLDRLDDDDRQSILHLESCLTSAGETERLADAVLQQLRELDQHMGSRSLKSASVEKLIECRNWLIDSVDGRVTAALALLAASMVAKNAAWQFGAYAQKFAPEYFSMEGVLPSDHQKLAARVATRWGTANAAAAIFEYPLSVATQKVWASMGLSMNTFQGAAIAVDMLAAGITLKTSGEEVHYNEGIGLALQAVAVLAYLGLISAFWSKLRGKETLVTAEPLNLDAATQSADTAAPLPTGQEAREQAAAISRLGKAFPDSARRNEGKKIQELRSRIEDVQGLLTQQGDQDLQSEEEGTIARNGIGVQNQMIHELVTQLTTYRQQLDQLTVPGNGEDVAEARTSMDLLLQKLEGLKEELERSGGRDPKTMLFFGTMSLAWFASLGGTIGAGLSPDPQLRNPNARGTVAAAGSVIGQTFAQLLHLAIKENPNHGPVARTAISTGISIGGTLFEFSLQQLGFALADQGKALAGKVPEAPERFWPTKPQMRTIMETLRMLLTVAFTNKVLGEKIEGHHLAATAISAGATALAVGLGYKQGEPKIADA
jgi:hypothetical protein